MAGNLLSISHTLPHNLIPCLYPISHTLPHNLILCIYPISHTLPHTHRWIFFPDFQKKKERDLFCRETFSIFCKFFSFLVVINCNQSFLQVFIFPCIKYEISLVSLHFLLYFQLYFKYSKQFLDEYEQLNPLVSGLIVRIN